MKRLIFAAILTGLCMLVVSCQKASAPPTEPPTLRVDAKACFVIRAGEGLWDIQDGTAKWADTLLLGERLRLSGQTAKAAAAGGQSRDYVEVTRDSGKTGWARSEYVISDCTLAVVSSEDAVLYTEPRNTAATGSSVPRLSIVAIRAEEAIKPFVRATWFNTAGLVLSRDVFIRSDVVSTKSEDVQCVILLLLAQASTNLKQKQALLSSAQKDYPGSAFMAQIDEALAAITEPTMSKATEAFAAAMVSTADGVDVRDAPDETAGALVARLATGQKVDVEERTKDSFTISGATSVWYRIKDPSGWVFGSALSPAE